MILKIKTISVETDLGISPPRLADIFLHGQLLFPLEQYKPGFQTWGIHYSLCLGNRYNFSGFESLFIPTIYEQHYICKE